MKQNEALASPRFIDGRANSESMSLLAPKFLSLLILFVAWIVLDSYQFFCIFDIFFRDEMLPCKTVFTRYIRQKRHFNSHGWVWCNKTTDGECKYAGKTTVL